ncbi:acyl-CoA thioester hydrolase [Rhodovulum iodosum]|uniref:Acyl-CoA thioester hydrolase n=1 Tax=Rhodovulum iodosum TaxID=68291 RepID=A0ABV3XV19_9RHOB|nr:thioesterase family protein [Rhodovulum robiginosum]
MKPHVYKTVVAAEWIDYNGHMRDAHYGLVFSHAVESFEIALGMDAAYRKATGCTFYLIEDHCFYLSEVKEGDPLSVEIRVLEHDEKRILLHQTMTSRGTVAAVSEYMELHVSQQDTPRAAPMPEAMQQILRDARLSAEETAGLRHRARPMGLTRGRA